jgi:ribosomal protein S12 methylthiotransferase RimO
MDLVYLVSLGCSKNLVDSEVMLGTLRKYTITDDPTVADVIIVNTCGFIGPAKEESLQTILSLHEKRKDGSLLVMAGCLTERYKEELSKELSEVDLITGVGDYDKIDQMIDEKKGRFSPSTYLIESESRVITGSNYHAYIKLSEGCNQTCSFCAIPSFKGKLISRELDVVVNEVKELTKRGFYDFSFISQDSSSYLRDFGVKDGLISLIEAIEKIDGVKSARILYLYPSTLSDKVLYSIIDSKVFHNYFEMPIQHISNKMLRVMKRGVGANIIKSQLQIMRDAPDSFLRTAFIIGHPQEREEEFSELVEFLKEFRFDRVSIFEYSDEEGTDAYNQSGKVDQNTISKRADILDKEVQKDLHHSLESEVGTEIEIVVQGVSSEHELFLKAKKLMWAEDIDGEILINDKEIDTEISTAQRYLAKITQKAGENLVGTIIKKI